MVHGHSHAKTVQPVPVLTGGVRDVKRCLYRISVPDDLLNCHVLIGMYRPWINMNRVITSQDMTVQ